MSQDGSALTGQETQDRRDILVEQFNKMEADTAAATVKTEEPASVAQIAPVEGRARDETGKFVPKEKTEVAPKAGAQQAQGVVNPAPVVQSEPWQTAPKSWKKELGQGWSGLDPAYQRYVHEREQQMKASYDAAAPKAALADKITKAAEPYMNTIRGLGMELPQAVAGLMQVDNELRTLPYEQKLQKLAQVAASYGIDLTGQLQNAQQSQPPQYANLQNELLTLKGRQEQFFQEQKAAQDRAAADEIQRFAATAEHFEEVKSTMAKLLQGGIAVGIPDAYEQAVRLHPEIFDAMQSAKQATAEADKKKAADEAAKRAKAAAVSVKSATPGAAKPTNAQDRRSMLREQFDGISERF